jgi:Predicted membrane protein
MLFQNSRTQFIKQLDVRAIEAATQAAEQRTTGEIRVSLLPSIPGSIETAAEKVAMRLKMTQTRDRNAVLILVQPAKRRFYIWGDKAIHEKLGDTFWADTAAAISERFRDRDFTGGIVHGIETIGRELARHFPPETSKRDQLSNEIDEGS